MPVARDIMALAGAFGLIFGLLFGGGYLAIDWVARATAAADGEEVAAHSVAARPTGDDDRERTGAGVTDADDDGGWAHAVPVMIDEPAARAEDCRRPPVHFSRAIAQTKGAISRCATAHDKRGETIPGILKIRLTAMPNGRFKKIAIVDAADPELAGGKLQRCLQSAFKMARLPKGAGGDCAAIVPLRLRLRASE